MLAVMRMSDIVYAAVVIVVVVDISLLHCECNFFLRENEF